MQAFQSTFPQGERLRPQGPLQQGTLRFNPRSRKGNDFLPSGGADRLNLFQSTFPQGERLLDVNRYDIANLVSIHVPARGTTIITVDMGGHVHGFNPRSRKGNDETASAWLDKTPVRFNPRSRKGNDELYANSSTLAPMFQSTFPQGERPVRFGTVTTISAFQSTFPQGERRLVLILVSSST